MRAKFNKLLISEGFSNFMMFFMLLAFGAYMFVNGIVVGMLVK